MFLLQYSMICAMLWATENIVGVFTSVLEYIRELSSKISIQNYEIEFCIGLHL